MGQDYWLYRASEHFKIPVSEVTKAQRSFAKTFYSPEAYLMGDNRLAEKVFK